MRNITRSGAGTLRPATSPVKQKQEKSSRASGQPKAASAAASPPRRPSLRQRVFNALCEVRPGGMTARQLHNHLGGKLSEIEAALVALAADGDILKHADPAHPENVFWKAPFAIYGEESGAGSAAESRRPFSTEAEIVFMFKKWPRCYRLPGLVGYKDFTAEEILDQVCIVLNRYEDDLHDLVARLAGKQPREAAELAEFLAIVEQTLCAGGLATDLDDTPAQGLSPRLRLDALARVQTLNKRRK